MPVFFDIVADRNPGTEFFDVQGPVFTNQSGEAENVMRTRREAAGTAVVRARAIGAGAEMVFRTIADPDPVKRAAVVSRGRPSSSVWTRWAQADIALLSTGTTLKVTGSAREGDTVFLSLKGGRGSRGGRERIARSVPGRSHRRSWSRPRSDRARIWPPWPSRPPAATISIPLSSRRWSRWNRGPGPTPCHPRARRA